MGRGNLEGEMTDVAMVEVVIKSSEKLGKTKRGTHKKILWKIQRSFLIGTACVEAKFNRKLFSILFSNLFLWS